MTDAKILEIFSSIQGEGKYAGVRQVFVRFFECNMHCAWCDTPASIGDTTRHYREMTLDGVFSKIEELWRNGHSVSLTGGEPLLQADFLSGLLPRLKSRQMPAYLETNGILPEALATVIAAVDIVAMDIKLPSSTRQPAYWQEHEEFLRLAKDRDVFVKAVVTSDTDEQDLHRAVDLISRVDPQIMLILQPNTYELKNGVMGRCAQFHDYCLRHLPNTRVMPQMHKFMKIR